MNQQLQTWNWTVAKEGNADIENDDACRVDWVGDKGDTRTLLIAISDGATEAVYSGFWARSLVAGAGPDWLKNSELEIALDVIRRDFRPFDPGRAKELPWYVREKFQTQGSQATLLLATIAETTVPQVGALRALAIGDSCLLLLRMQDGHYIYRPFPLADSRQFGTSPTLVRNRLPNDLTCSTMRTDLHTGDVLLAATDAVAKWAMECFENGLAHLVPQFLLELIGDDPQRGASVNPLRHTIKWRRRYLDPPAGGTRCGAGRLRPSRWYRWFHLNRGRPTHHLPVCAISPD